MKCEIKNHKTCSFFGHRNIEITKQLEMQIIEVVEEMIVNCSVSTFLFGSKSNFDNLCHMVVSKLKEKYPNIKRVVYTCKGESCIFESEMQEWKEAYARLGVENVTLLGAEEEFEHKTKYTSGRASYVERNQAMIDDSDYCIFYYDENYRPNTRKYTKQSAVCYQPKSGTKLAYDYARRKGKILINLNNN